MALILMNLALIQVDIDCISQNSYRCIPFLPTFIFLTVIVVFAWVMITTSYYYFVLCDILNWTVFDILL